MFITTHRKKRISHEIMQLNKVNIYLLILMCYFVDRSLSANPDCTQWQEYCSSAQKQTNPKFKCIDGYIYYFEDKDRSQPWDKARQLCSQKFNGSYDADLVELSEGIQMDSAIKMLSNEMLGLSNPETEMTTNGVCCLMKEDGAIPHSKYVCQWLKSGQQIVNFEIKGDQDKCQILTVTFNKNTKEFNSTNGLIDKTSTDPFPYLCQYKAPINCATLPTEPPTQPPTLPPTQPPTTSPTLPNSNSTECKKWKNSCKLANSESNINNKCIGDSVFYFGLEALPWDKSRQLCSLMFNNSKSVNLVELQTNRMSNVNKMMHKILETMPNKSVEIVTNGMCCHKSDEGSNETQLSCEWLSNLEKFHIKESPNQIPVHECRVLSITFMFDVLDEVFSSNQKYIDPNNGPSLPYLCSYTSPEGCV